MKTRVGHPEEINMKPLRRVAWAAVLACAVSVAPVAMAARQKDSKNTKEGDPRPKLALKATPMMAIAPVRVVFTAELTGGANDFQEYYCPSVEWDWGEGTVSQSTGDCDPYEPGKSEIKRRFTIEHTYARGGAFRVFFRLKQRDKLVGTASTNVQVRPGMRELG
jgi:hypothetical protein